MIPIQLTITGYNKEENIFKATTTTGHYINFDPFVLCAIPLSDGEYETGKAFDMIGNTYILSKYDVRPHGIFPIENGITLVSD